MNNTANSTKRKYSWKKIALLTLGVVVLLALLGGGYIAATVDIQQDEKTEGENLYLSPKNEPFVSSNTPPAPSFESPAVPEAPAEPSPIPEVTTTKTYSNSTLQFSVTVPSNWEITQLENEVIISSPNARYNVQMYKSPGSNMETLRNFLSSQSNLRNIAVSNIAGKLAYTFSIDGAYKKGYAFLDQERLYYVLGTGVESSAVGLTFKTL